MQPLAILVQIMNPDHRGRVRVSSNKIFLLSIGHKKVNTETKNFTTKNNEFMLLYKQNSNMSSPKDCDKLTI